MKIIILIQCTNLGGMEHNMLLLIDEIQKMNFEVEVVSINPIGKLGELLDSKGILNEGSTYSGPWGFCSIFKLHRILARKKADGLLMIGHNLMGEIALGQLCKKHRVLSIHYHHQGVKSPLGWKIVYGIAVLKFRAIVFVSKYIMQEAISIAPFLDGVTKMVSTPVVAHPAFTDSERSAARRILDLQENEIVVGNAGWLITRKRWDVFLNVAAEVLKSDPNIRFIIAGDGPERASLELLTQELGISDKIIWLGWHSTLVPFYQAIDILLFNSDWDAQARTPLEAMSYGVPLVASILSGGTREVVEHEKMGFLIDRHDYSLLSEIILKLARDKKLRQELGECERKRIIEYGSPRLHAVKVLASMGFQPLDDECTRWCSTSE